MTSPSLFDMFVTGVREVQSIRFAELSATTIIVYDHIITLDDEIELIWKSSWSLGKVLFIINRYYTLAAVVFNNYALFGPTLTDSLCVISSVHILMHSKAATGLYWFHWQGWNGLVACMIAEIILQMRLFALYFLNKKVLVLMISSFLIASATSAVVLVTAFSGITATSNAIPGIPFCVASSIPEHFYLFWIPILSFETLLCWLALFRGFQTINLNGSLFQSGRHIVNILIRDSVIYFLLMFAAYLTNMLIWVAGSHALLEIPSGFSTALSCVLGNRLIINIRNMSRDSKQTKVIKRRGGDTSFFTPADTFTDWEMWSKQAYQSHC